MILRILVSGFIVAHMLTPSGLCPRPFRPITPNQVSPVYRKSSHLFAFLADIIWKQVHLSGSRAFSLSQRTRTFLCVCCLQGRGRQVLFHCAWVIRVGHSSLRVWCCVGGRKRVVKGGRSFDSSLYYSPRVVSKSLLPVTSHASK